MKASEVIAIVDRKHDNVIAQEDKIQWINDIELNIYSQVIKEPYVMNVDIVAEQDSYTLTGILMEDILKLSVSGQEYNLGSVLLDDEPYTYYKKNGELAISPKPTKDIAAGMEIVYRWKPLKITELTVATRDLLLPDQFLTAYEYYLRSMISMEQRNAAEASAWGGYYNQAINEFTKYYLERVPNIAAKKRNKNWRG